MTIRLIQAKLTGGALSTVVQGSNLGVFIENSSVEVICDMVFTVDTNQQNETSVNFQHEIVTLIKTVFRLVFGDLLGHSQNRNFKTARIFR